MALASTPRTWVAGEFVTAAEMNTEVRDNLTALGAGIIPVAPTTTFSAGTASAGADVLDTVLGTYVFTAIAGHRYQARCDSVAMTSSVLNDVVGMHIRNGGASTPTAASTIVATMAGVKMDCNVGLPINVAFAGSFVPGAGTQTLGLFTSRVTGTGAESTTGFRELYVIDLGTV